MVQLTGRIEQQSEVRPVPASRILLAGMMLAGVLAILVARWWTGTGYEPVPLGLPDPGLLTSVGLPVVQFVHEIAGVAVVGLLFLRCAALPGRDTPAGRHLLTMAARWSWLWVASTAVWIVLTMSDLVGTPVTGLFDRADVLLTVAGTDRVLAELATAWVALLIALFADRISGAGPRWAVLLVAIAALLPSALSGHAGHHSSPTMAMVVLAVHLAASAVWVGGLLALIVHLRPFQLELRMALPTVQHGRTAVRAGHRLVRSGGELYLAAGLAGAVGKQSGSADHRQDRGSRGVDRHRLRAPATHTGPGR